MAEIEDIYYSTDYSNLNMMNAQSLDLYLASCGWQNCSPRHWFGPAIKRYSMIHVVRRGKGRMRLGGKLYEIHKDQAFYIPPRVEVWYQADDTDPWDYVWFAFEGLKEASCVENAGFSMKEPVRDICCTEEVCAYVHQMMDAHQLSFDNELRRNGLLFLCMSKLVEDYWTVTGLSTGHHFYPGEVYVKAAQEYISSHFHERIKINELADLIGVNRSYLTRNFKAIVGCSPQEMLINLRIEKAKSLLMTTQLPINEVASAVGYSDQLAFSRLFKRCCGQSPRAYRELHLRGQTEEK